MSGNKVRKLEFLMADAVAQGADCIITIGGIQSNHCRATAVAAKYLNLDCYLILRTSKVKPLIVSMLCCVRACVFVSKMNDFDLSFRLLWTKIQD